MDKTSHQRGYECAKDDYRHLSGYNNAELLRMAECLDNDPSPYAGGMAAYIRELAGKRVAA